MKQLFIISVLSLLCTMNVNAQSDDMYFASSKSKKAKSGKTTVASSYIQQVADNSDNNGSVSNEPETYYSGSMRSVDEYNRRGRYAYQSHRDDSLALGDSITLSMQDYNNLKRMQRFDGYRNVTVVIDDDPWYWDSWYWNSWHMRPWHYRYAWYDPWYDPWYSSWYDPWYWHGGWGWSIGYTGWHSRWHGGWHAGYWNHGGHWNHGWGGSHYYGIRDGGLRRVTENRSYASRHNPATVASHRRGNERTYNGQQTTSNTYRDNGRTRNMFEGNSSSRSNSSSSSSRSFGGNSSSSSRSSFGGGGSSHGSFGGARSSGGGGGRSGYGGRR